MLSKAIAIAAKAHEGQYDKGGKPYILHPLQVMEYVKEYGEVAMIVAVQHDAFTQNLIDSDHLRSEGFGEDIIEPLIKLKAAKNSSGVFEVMDIVKGCRVSQIVSLAVTSVSLKYRIIYE